MLALRTVASVTTVAVTAITAIATIPAVTATAAVTPVTTISAFRAVAFFRFYITFRFGHQHFTAQAQFTCFLIGAYQLYFYFVALFQYAIQAIEAAPAYFRDMQQTLFARHEFDECTEWHDA